MAASERKVREYSNSELIFGNLAIIIWIAFGSITCGIFYFMAGIGYFALASYLVFYEIGKHGCITCYYCKTCTIGMGKLPEFFFTRQGTANVNRRAKEVFKFVFILLSLVPTALIIFSVIQQFILYKILLLIATSAFSLYCGIVRGRTLIT